MSRWLPPPCPFEHLAIREAPLTGSVHYRGAEPLSQGGVGVRSDVLSELFAYASWVKGAQDTPPRHHRIRHYGFDGLQRHQTRQYDPGAAGYQEQRVRPLKYIYKAA
jgi:hypothetical protein